SQEREFSLRTETGLTMPEDFEALVVGRGEDGYLIRLGDVAEARIEPEDSRFFSRSNGVAGISLGVVPQSKANILEVNRAVTREIERLKPTVPDDIRMSVAIDFSTFVEESMRSVLTVFVEALIFVLIVIFAFVGSLRADRKSVV